MLAMHRWDQPPLAYSAIGHKEIRLYYDGFSDQYVLEWELTGLVNWNVLPSWMEFIWQE